MFFFGETRMVSAAEQFQTAENLLAENKLEELFGFFRMLKEIKEIAPFCHYRRVQIFNIACEPETAYNLYYQALDAMPDIFSNLLQIGRASCRERV